MTTEKEARFRASLLEWSTQNLRDFAWREPNRSLYEVFVAEFFLTQTPAENVASVYPTFLERFPSLDAIEEATRDELVEIIEPLGFYNIRADALKTIAAEYDSLPDEPDELSDLQRVGQYVANATLCFAHREPLPVLDRNVERIYGRMFGEEWPDSPSDQLQFATRLVPKDDARAYNLALLDFGASVCQPDPLCQRCFASGYCKYDNQTT